MVKAIFGEDISVSASDHVTNLQETAARKREAVSAALAAAATAQSYAETNGTYILPAELSDFNAKKSALLTASAIKNIHDVGSTIQPVLDATNTFNDWFNAAFKPAVEARKAAEQTPPADPSPSTDPAPPADPPADPTPIPEP